MNRKQIQRQNHISMEKFLKTYCHIENENLIDMLSNLSHHELKEVLKELYKIKLSTLPFDLVSPEKINTGEVLMVTDIAGNSAPYINPTRINERQTFADIIDSQEGSKTRDDGMEYEEIVDAIEEYLTDENTDISSLAPFDIPKTKQFRKEMIKW